MMDLSNSKSVRTEVPMKENRGEVSLIPVHFRAGSTNPRAVVQGVKRFRSMSQAMQLVEVEKAKNWNSKEKRI